MDEATFLAQFRRAGTRAAHPGTYLDPHPAVGDWAVFGATLTAVGGAMLSAERGWRAAVQSAIDLDAGPVVAAPPAEAWLAGITDWAPARAVAEPHACAEVGLAIIVAELAVAENSAVLLSSDALPCRALGFLAQRLLILVPENRIVGGMITGQRHAAELQRRRGRHHVTWMSGPSKTADIEQCLVIGAHGARALTVVVTDPA